MKLAILGSGMMTGVGLNAPAACAAMRAGISAFTETRYKNKLNEWVIGCPVPLEQPWRGSVKLARLAAPPIHECLTMAGGVKPEAIPVLLCVAEPGRPGRAAGLDQRLLPEIQKILGVHFHARSVVIAQGRVGGAAAVELARKLIHEEGFSRCIVAGVDSFLVESTLSAYEAKHRLLTTENSNGFIPGEAAAAVLVGPAGATSGPELRCRAIGFGQETATVESEEPLRADGLVAAYRAMQANYGVTLDETDYRYTDCNGEQYGFKEDRLAFSRVVRKLKGRYDHLHPADSIGEIGAAVGPCVLGMALTAAQKRYAQGPGVLCHFSNDGGERAALILRYGEKDGVQ